MLHPNSSVVDEIEKQKPRISPQLLSRQEKDRLVERGLLGLYRWYVARSQETRNWNPDYGFDWRALRRDHSPQMLTIIEGYYAIEQYAPDYTSQLTRLLRRSYGRSHYAVRWGSEEAKHSDLWRNALLFSGARNEAWIEQYTNDLRENSYALPWEEPLRMLIYALFQERATQMSYLNTAKIARGESPNSRFANDADSVLAKALTTIAIDEAAHFSFFLEGARLFLYYLPEETIHALVDVLRSFVMPAADIIYNYEGFVKAAYEADVFGRRKYARDVVQPILASLGATAPKEMDAGIRRSKQAPDAEGRIRDAGLFEGIDFTIVESGVRSLFARIGKYEEETGLWEVAPTHFVPTSREGTSS